MKPEIGDKVFVKEYSGSYEGIVYSVPKESHDYFHVGTERGITKYADLEKITILFRPEYKYVNRCLYKVGDLVSWMGEQALVIELAEWGDYNYRVSRLNYSGVLTYAREQDLTLIHAAEHPEVEAVKAPVIEFIEGPEPEGEPEGWWGYTPEKPEAEEVEEDDIEIPF